MDPAAAINENAAPGPDRDFTVILLRGDREEARALGARIAEPRLIVYAPIGAEPQVFDFGRNDGDASIVTPGDRGRFVGLSTVAAGADGLMIEVHPNPEVALSDGPQSLKPERFETLMKELIPFAHASGKQMPGEA